MLKSISLFSALLLVVVIPVNAQPTTAAPDYRQLVTSSILRDYPRMLHEPTPPLAFPFITPGSVYTNQLWDWDSWFSDVALCQIMTDQGNKVDKQKMLSYGCGCVLNFLAAATPDGEIPIQILVNTRSKPVPATQSNHASNMHKPVLAQHAAFLVKLDNGNADWLRAKFPALEAFEKNYREHQFHEPTGLYFWKDDLAIGVDNDPATFFRPPNSSGSIFLNCLMYKELVAMAYLSQTLQLDPGVAQDYQKQADALKLAIQNNCWDERDGYYYSVDLNLRPISNEPGNYMGSRFVLHKGHPRDYDCLIQRLEGWSGFMAMWSGIATPEQAKRMVDEHLKNPKTLGAAFGIRSLSKMEKMYGLYASSNPSNWDGPIWGISNYVVFRGLVKYGFQQDAREMADKTIDLFGRDFQANGALHEYYNPDTGEPIMNKGFQNWNYLVMNMMAWEENRTPVEEF
jgi:Glycosyl hydrolase family 63 C-terminal domain